MIILAYLGILSIVVMSTFLIVALIVTIEASAAVTRTSIE